MLHQNAQFRPKEKMLNVFNRNTGWELLVLDCTGQRNPGQKTLSADFDDNLPKK